MHKTIQNYAYEIAAKLHELNGNGGNLKRTLPELQAYFSKEHREIISVENLVGYINDGFSHYYSNICLRSKMLADNNIELITCPSSKKKKQVIDRITLVV